MVTYQINVFSTFVEAKPVITMQTCFTDNTIPLVFTNPIALNKYLCMSGVCEKKILHFKYLIYKMIILLVFNIVSSTYLQTILLLWVRLMLAVLHVCTCIVWNASFVTDTNFNVFSMTHSLIIFRQNKFSCLVCWSHLPWLPGSKELKIVGN